MSLKSGTSKEYRLAYILRVKEARRRSGLTGLFSFGMVLVELLSTRSCLESHAQCWFAADIAASLAVAGPPRDVPGIPCRYRDQRAKAA